MTGPDRDGTSGDSSQDAAHVDPVRSHWTEKVDDWITWSNPMTVMAERFNWPFLEEIGIQPGETVLDLASGVGEPALTAASLVGTDGMVIATDFVPEMLDGLRRRVEPHRLQLTAADMTALPFPDEIIDRISCRFGIMFVPDAVKAALECWRVLKPGGRIGFMVWGPRDDQTLFSVLANAVEDFLNQGHDEHHFAIFRFGDDDSLPAILRQTPFDNIREISLRFSPKVQVHQTFWHAQLDMSFGHLLRDLDEDARKELDHLIRDRFSPYVTEDGLHYQLAAHIKIVTADKTA